MTCGAQWPGNQTSGASDPVGAVLGVWFLVLTGLGCAVTLARPLPWMNGSLLSMACQRCGLICQWLARATWRRWLAMTSTISGSSIRCPVCGVPFIPIGNSIFSLGLRAWLLHCCWQGRVANLTIDPTDQVMTWRMKCVRIQLLKPGNCGLTKGIVLRCCDSLARHLSFLLRWKCLTGVFNRCAARKSCFHFATRGLVRKCIVEEPREESRIQRHLCNHLWPRSLHLHHWLYAAEDDLRAGANFVDEGMRAGARFTVSPFDRSCGFGVLFVVFFFCFCFVCYLPTRPFHSWLLGLPTTSSIQVQGLPQSSWCAQQWTKKNSTSKD